MSEGRGLLEAILAEPDDDTPRLVYADWLEEQDEQERAEFVRVQCELARLPETDARRPGLQRREADLLEAHRAAWEKELPPWARSGCEFRRGFVATVSISAEHFLKEGDHLRSVLPLKGVSLLWVSHHLEVDPGNWTAE